MSNKVISITASGTSKTNLEVYKDVDLTSSSGRLSSYIFDYISKDLSGIHVGSTELSDIMATLPEESTTKLYNIGTLHHNRQKLVEADYKMNKLVNVLAIKNSLHNIFTWTPGERVINPEFGNNLHRLLYNGITPFNVEQIMAEIRHCITTWEPRVRVDKIVNIGTIDDTEDNTVHLEIIYSIPSLTDEQFNYSFIYQKAS